MGIQAIKPLVPPILIDLVRMLRRQAISVRGDFNSWENASAKSSGYNHDEIIRRVVAASRAVRDGKAAYERDSVTFDKLEYAWPLLASLLQVASEKSSLRVIDFGGALGSTWWQNKKFLDRLEIPKAWRIVEQPQLVTIGQAEFSNDVVSFYSNILDAAQDDVDVILFASSLCYVPDPQQFVTEAGETSASFIIIDRLPTIPGNRDRIAIQYVGEPIYNASYPIRIFGRERLLTELFQGWRLIESWNSELQPTLGCLSKGYFLERIIADPN